MTNKVVALVAAELKLLMRNRTVAVSAIGLPVALGLFWALTFDDGDPMAAVLLLSVQLALVLGMGVYVTSTGTVVARRHAKVLKRMRTSGVSDPGLLVATVAPSVLVGLGQLAFFGVVNTAVGVPMPADPLPLVLAFLGGLALCVLAALATAIVTPTPERAQITTLPLTFVLLVGGIALPFAPAEGAWRALVAIPGAGVGDLTRLAYVGGTWEAGPAGLPALLPAVAALVLWTVLFAVFTRRRFRWDDRSA